MTDVRPGEPGDEARSPAPVWGAGNVVLRPTKPTRFPRWRLVGRVLGGIAAVVGTVAAPFLMLGLLGLLMSEGRDRGEPYPEPSPTPVATATAVPDAFGGHWAGNARHFQGSEVNETWTIEVDLYPGTTTGRLVVRELGCSEGLTELGGTVDELQFSTLDEEDGQCLPSGNGTLTFRSPQRLDFGWGAGGDDWENQAYGSMSKP